MYIVYRLRGNLEAEQFGGKVKQALTRVGAS
jgi:hypothetical protein